MGWEEMVDALMDAIRCEFYSTRSRPPGPEGAWISIGLISNWDCSLQRVVRDLGLNAYLECVIISRLRRRSRIRAFFTRRSVRRALPRRMHSTSATL